jgi:CDP-4-dehydro-6-deoxyglucose reductase, E3
VGHALENGSRRPIHLYWGARAQADLYEEAQVLEWLARYPQLKFTAVLSEASAAHGAHQRLGWVHEAVLREQARLEDFEVYAAGPPAMIEALRASLPGQGLAPERLHFDSFDYAPDVAR